MNKIEHNRKNTLELIRLMKEYLEENWTDFDCFGGLCGMANAMQKENWITFNEVDRIHCYLDDNVPPGSCPTNYWWPKGDPVPRLKWLEGHIKRLEKIYDE